MGKGSNIKRDRLPVPGFISHALAEHKLMSAYTARPDYQQNDYIGWILRAKKQKTREKRLQQMLDELELGGVYMNMDHPPVTKIETNFRELPCAAELSRSTHRV